MGTHPIFESDFDCLTESRILLKMESAKKILLTAFVTVSGQGLLLAGLLSFSFGMRYVVGYTLLVASIAYFINKNYGFEKFFWMILMKCGDFESVQERPPAEKKTN